MVSLRCPARAVAAAVIFGVSVTGCTSGNEPNPTVGPSLPATPSPLAVTRAPSPDSTLAAADAVRTTYLAFTGAVDRALASPDQEHPELERYATDEALAGVGSTLLLYRQQDIVLRGTTSHEPSVSRLSLNGAQPTATIQDCVDLGDAEPVYERTGKSVAPSDQSKRHTATAEAVYLDNRWMIRAVLAERSRQC